MDKVKSCLLALPKGQKRLLQVSVDVLLVWSALGLAFSLHVGGGNVRDAITQSFWLFVFAPIISIPIFIRMGMYRAVMRYFGNDALIAIIKAVTLSSALLAVLDYLFVKQPVSVPLAVIFNYWVLGLIILGGLRLFMRQYFMGDWFAAAPVNPLEPTEERETRVAIYGAGVAGNQLVAALRMGRSMRPVAFIDDDPGIANRSVAGLHVYKPKYIQRMIEETGAQEILLALPSVSRARRKEILNLLETFPLHVRSVPTFSDLASGRVKVEDIREVDIADLLGRDPVPPHGALLSRCIYQRVVMVTGAGGSIGSELCRQILTLEPSMLILFEHSEFNLYSIHQELEQEAKKSSFSTTIVPVLGSVRDPIKLVSVMQAWKVETIYHAAAYKHVPLIEHNIAEGVLNNVMGTLHAAQSALRTGVENFVLISTDKAVRPTNVMGSSKRLAEMVLQALSQEATPSLFGDTDNVSYPNKTRFSMVRFGNVLGSCGSVVPLFRSQIKAGGPVTVTHPEITRFFMTIPEAAQLVIQAGAMGKGGDVFVLDMGVPVRIAELAERMIQFSGLSIRSEANPQGDIAIEFTGLRPGEKLYEELLIGGQVSETEHPMIMKAREDYLPWDVYKRRLTELSGALEQGDLPKVQHILRETVSGYRPEKNIKDWIYLKNQKGLINA